MIYIYIFS